MGVAASGGRVVSTAYLPEVALPSPGVCIGQSRDGRRYVGLYSRLQKVILGLKQLEDLAEQGYTNAFNVRSLRDAFLRGFLPSGGSLKDATQHLGHFRTKASPGPHGERGE